MCNKQPPGNRPQYPAVSKNGTKKGGAMLFCYITSGTIDYLQKIQKDHPGERLYLLQEEDVFLLMHETEGKTIFKEPHSYEIFESEGDIGNSKFAVINYVPVTDEGRPVFEYRFKNRAKLIDKQPGFKGIRVLRPLKSDTYLVATFWKDEFSYTLWKQSQAFAKAHETSGKSKSKKEKKKVYPRPSYVKTYSIIHDEE